MNFQFFFLFKFINLLILIFFYSFWTTKGRHPESYNKDHSEYTRDSLHPFNSSTHQQHGSSNVGSNHNGTHTQGGSSLGPGIIHAGGSHNGIGTNHHPHAMMGPLSDAEFNFSTHLGNRGNFIDCETSKFFSLYNFLFIHISCF